MPPDKSIYEQIHDFVTDKVCDMSPGTIIGTMALTLWCEKETGLHMKYGHVSKVLSEMCEGDEPEVKPYFASFYEKLAVESNQVPTTITSTDVLRWETS